MSTRSGEQKRRWRKKDERERKKKKRENEKEKERERKKVKERKRKSRDTGNRDEKRGERKEPREKRNAAGSERKASNRHYAQHSILGKQGGKVYVSTILQLWLSPPVRRIKIDEQMNRQINKNVPWQVIQTVL